MIMKKLANETEAKGEVFGEVAAAEIGDVAFGNLSHRRKDVLKSCNAPDFASQRRSI